MRKKCKTCGAPLTSDRCDYCGTSYGSRQSTAADVANFENNDIPGFDIPSMDMGTPSQQHGQMMMEPKGFNPAIIIGIVVGIIIIGGLLFFLSSGSRTETLSGPIEIVSTPETETPISTPVTDSALLGYWENGSGRIFLWVFDEASSVEFLENGTVIIIQPDGDRSTVSWNHTGPGAFTANGRHFTYSIDGGVLTITDSANDDWRFNRGENDRGEGSGTVVPVDDSALLGYWENGSGRIFLFVFNRADSVEFLANGTVIITENGARNTVDWMHTGPGAFTADGRQFTYSISGGVLTITDSANDDWVFDRGEDIAIIDGGDVDTDTDESTDDSNATVNNDVIGISNSDLVGTWEWDSNNDFIYIFNVDGTATRGFSRSRIDFEWEIIEGSILNMYIGNHTEQWEAVIENGVLTISNLNDSNVWSYIRVD